MGIATLCLGVHLLIPGPVKAAESDITLTLNVPGTHSVQLVIGGGGVVNLSGVEHRGNKSVNIARLSEQEYLVKADSGWQIESVRYTGIEQKQTNEKLTQLNFTAPVINDDGQKLIVVFAEDASTAKPPTITTELQDEVDKIEKEDLKELDYTTDSWKDLEDAYTKAKEVLKNQNATQAEVDEALKNLIAARANLKKAAKLQLTGPGWVGVNGQKPLSTTTIKGKAVNTSDMSNTLLHGILLVIASGMIVVLKKKQKNKSKRNSRLS